MARCIATALGGGTFHEVPAHHNAGGHLDAYIEAARVAGDAKSPAPRPGLPAGDPARAA